MCNFFLESKDLPPIACCLYGKPGPDGGGKSMIVGVPRETYPGERRVALVPAVIPNLKKAGLEVVVETGAGLEAGYPDTEYTAKGAKMAAKRAEVFSAADILLQVLCYGSNDKTGKVDLPLLRRGQVLIGFLRQLGSGHIRVRSPASCQRAGPEPRRTVRGAPAGGQRRGGCGRLRARAGRIVLSAAARAAGPRGGRKRRGDHGGSHPGKDLAGAGDPRDGGAHGAGFRHSRFGRRTRRELRTDKNGGENNGIGRHDHPLVQSGQQRALPRQPDVQPQYFRVSSPHDPGRKNPVRHGG